MPSATGTCRLSGRCTPGCTSSRGLPKVGPIVNDDIILQQITITRFIAGDTGVESIRIEHYPADQEVNYITTLGLIEAAKHHFTESIGHVWVDPDQGRSPT